MADSCHRVVVRDRGGALQQGPALSDVSPEPAESCPFGVDKCNRGWGANQQGADTYPHFLIFV